MISSPVATPIPIDHVSAVHVAARTARTSALAVGLPTPMPDQAAVVASELASNISKHAWDGVVYVSPLLLGAGITITAVDRGPGMSDVDRCLTDGHTTTGTLGVGLGAVRRMTSELAITSDPHGTLVTARLWPPGDNPAPDLDHLVLPADGEDVCGDTVAAARTADETTLLVVDGLGHGAAATEAAHAAEHAFHQDPSAPLPHLMTRVHQGIRHTRGAAVALLRVAERRVSFCGIGNISTAVLTGAETHHFLSTPGVVGLRSQPPTQHDATVPAGSIVVAHSDGLDNKWLFGPPRQLPARLLAAELVRNHRRRRDDASVVITLVPNGTT